MARRVTLTFDNGPTPGVTAAVLELLARKGLAATFFIIGNKLSDPGARALMRDAHAGGHWIGNHTLTHSVPLGEARDAATARHEIEETQARIGACAHPDKLFRPFGKSGLIGPHLLSRAALSWLLERRYCCVLWTSVPRDWCDPDGWVDRCIADVEAVDWSVVALHDVAGPISAMLAGIAIAAVVGAINGYLVAYLRLNSLITTLGGYAALQGVANVTSAGGLQLVKDPASSWFGVFGRGFILNIPVPDILFLGLALFGVWVLSQTNYGRAVKAVGGNELASRYSSIDAKAVIFSAYMASALLTAIAAIVLSSRAMSAQSDSGAGLEITVLSAIFLGGTSLGGGVGGIGRTVLGVIVLAFISNAMILIGLPIQAQWLVSAVVIILAVWLDAATRRGTVIAP